MKRFLAVLAAVAMIALGLAVRSAINGNGNSDDDAAGSTPHDGSEGLTIVCGPELLAACNAIAESTEGVAVSQADEWATAEALAAGRLELTANRVWLAAGDWPAIAAAGQRADSGDTATNISELAASGIFARSPAVMVGRTDRMEAATAACEQIDWSCVGDAAGKEWTALGGQPAWGKVKVALPDVDVGPGMVSVNQAVASRVGTSNFATNDLDQSGVTNWFDHLAGSSASNSGSTTPLVEFISRPHQLSIVGALESEAVEELDGVALAGSLTVVAPEPVATADVRLWAADDAVLKNTLATLDPDHLRKALRDSGWRTTAGNNSSEAPSLPSGAVNIDASMASLDSALPDIDPPESSGLPSPGTVFTVNNRWRRAQ